MERVTFSIKISDIVSIVESVTYEASKSAPDVRTASGIAFDDSDDVQHGTLLASLGSAMAALCNRTHVNAKTAQTIKERMQNCKCLLYATSENSSSSKWMPWETGLMDGLNGRVAICPLMGGSDSNFNGQEYLSLYPFLSYEKAESGKDTLWINEGSKYVKFSDWLKGQEPYNHS